jgi:hypothetical protein
MNQCKYSQYGICNVTSENENVLRRHEQEVEFHVEKFAMRLKQAEEKCVILQRLNDHLMQVIRSNNLPPVSSTPSGASTVASSGTSSGVTNGVSSGTSNKKKRLFAQCLPVELPRQEIHYPLEMKLQETSDLQIVRCQAFGKEVPSYLASGPTIAGFQASSFPQLPTGVNHLLLIELECQKDWPDTMHVCMIPKPFSYTSFTAESPLSTYAVNGSHFVLSDCLRYSNLEDAFAGRMLGLGMYSFTGLVELSPSRRALIVKLKQLPPSGEHVVHFLISDGSSYTCTVPVSLTSRLYSAGSVVCQLIRENSWKAETYACSVPLGQSLCIGNFCMMKKGKEGK